MTVLDRLYASSGDEVIHRTLHIVVGDSTLWLTKGWDDITATLEDGTTEAKFIASAIDIALPARNKDGTQDLKFAIGNINGEASTIIRDALDNLSSATLTFRNYISTDLTAPASAPIQLAIKSGYWTSTEAQITAGYMNICMNASPFARLPLF